MQLSTREGNHHAEEDERAENFQAVSMVEKTVVGQRAINDEIFNENKVGKCGHY